jgi:polyhydroxyalkanoate synthesis regulator phasin
MERQQARAGAAEPDTEAVVVVPDQEVPVKPSLGESLLEMPYTQSLVRRGEDLAAELRERGNRLSQSVAEHGGKVTHDLIDRSGELTRDLIGRGGQTSQEMLRQSERAVKELRKQSEKAARTMRKQSEKAARRLTKQSQKASKELTRRSERISQDLLRRSQEFTQDLVERNGRAWAIVGFGVGLISATAIVYVFIRRRLFGSQEEEADQHILLSPNGYKNLNSETRPAVTTTPSRELNGSVVQTTEPISTTNGVVVPEKRETTTGETVPADATLVGIVSTRRYYPVETPLDKLQPQPGVKDSPTDLVYFGSEEEARAQGFSAADEGAKNS